MSIYELISKYRIANPTGHFFDKSTLKFFGERLSEMTVLRNTPTMIDVNGDEHECYIVSALQRNHPDGPTRAYHCFDKHTMKPVVF